MEDIRIDSCINLAFRQDIQFCGDRNIFAADCVWCNEPCADSCNAVILRHAWLSPWNKHMTTGRINQISIAPKFWTNLGVGFLGSLFEGDTPKDKRRTNRSQTWNRNMICDLFCWLWLLCVCVFVLFFGQDQKQEMFDWTIKRVSWSLLCWIFRVFFYDLLCEMRKLFLKAIRLSGGRFLLNQVLHFALLRQKAGSFRFERNPNEVLGKHKNGRCAWQSKRQQNFFGVVFATLRVGN